MRPLTEPAGPPPADPETDSGVFDLATLVTRDPGGAIPRRRVSLAPIVPWAPVETRPKPPLRLYVGLLTAFFFAVGGLGLAYAASRMAPLAGTAMHASVDSSAGAAGAHSVEPHSAVAADRPAPSPSATNAGDDTGEPAVTGAEPADGAATTAARRTLAAARVDTVATPRSVVPPGPARAERASTRTRYLPPELPAETLDRSVEALLDAAIAGEGRPDDTPPSSGLPALPDRNAVRDVMDGLEDAILACAPGANGRAEARITVHGPTGTVRVARMGGDFATRPQRGCMEAVLADARFAPFDRDRFTITYPYRL